MSFLPGLSSIASDVGGAVKGLVSNPVVDLVGGAAAAYFGAPYVSSLFGGAAADASSSSAVDAAIAGGDQSGALAPTAGPSVGGGGSGSGFSSLLSGLGSAIGPALGGLVTGGASYAGSAATNAAAMEMQQQAEQYNTQMSNTSWQRGVKDMEAAGLSPMLAYGQGGASAPTIAAAPVQNKLGGAVTAGVAGAQAAAQIQNTLAQNDLINNQAAGASADAMSKQIRALRDVNLYRSGQPDADVKLLNYDLSSKHSATDVAAFDAGLREAQYRGDISDAANRQSYIESWVGKNDRYIQPLSNAAETVMDTIGTAARLPFFGGARPRFSNYGSR